MKTAQDQRETLRRAADSYIEALLRLEGDHSNSEGELADIYDACRRLIADVEDAARLLGISKETLDEFEKADHSWEGREAWWYDHGLTTRRALADFLKEPNDA